MYLRISWCLWVILFLLFFTHAASIYHISEDKILCKVISFLVVSYIFLSSLHLKKTPLCFIENWSSQIFIPLMKFLLPILVFRRFFIRLRPSFRIFLSYPLVWWWSIPPFPSTCIFSFFQKRPNAFVIL